MVIVPFGTFPDGFTLFPPIQWYFARVFFYMKEKLYTGGEPIKPLMGEAQKQQRFCTLFSKTMKQSHFRCNFMEVDRLQGIYYISDMIKIGKK